jgi:hypothetical protein
VDSIAKPPRTLTLPVLGLTVDLPAPERVAWYVGIGITAALGVIDWEVAMVIGVGHLISDTINNRAVKQMAEGIEAGG